MLDTMMSSTNFHRTIKEFLIKSLEFILSTRCPAPDGPSPSPQNHNPCLQLVLTETHAIRSLYPQVWMHDLETPLRVYLELIRSVEGCRPLLVERWEFLFSPTEQLQTPDCPHTYLKKSAISLRSLLLASLQWPAYTDFRGTLAFHLCFQLDELTPWSTKARPQDLVSFPKQLFRVQTPAGSLSARALFWKTPPQPDIIPQALGYRQRLISVETEETKEIPETREVFGSWSSSSHGSGHSTNSNPPFNRLTHFPLNRRKDQSEGSNTLSQVVLKCALPDMGFTPLSPDVVQGQRDSSDGELGSEERPEMEPQEGGGEVTEDAKVAIFSLKCERGLKGKLFSSMACSVTDGIRSLKQSLEMLKATKEQLLGQQRSQLLA